MSLTLRTISREQHLAYIQSLPSASHMQVPAWADVKAEWRSESLGWLDTGGELDGVGLVLYRQLPKIKRYLAYLPEGPVINWYAPNLDEWLQPMLAHLKEQGDQGSGDSQKFILVERLPRPFEDFGRDLLAREWFRLIGLVRFHGLVLPAASAATSAHPA